MQAPDISAGRGGLASLGDALGRMQEARTHLSNSLSTFHNQLSQSTRNIYSMLNDQEMKNYARMRDSVQDRANERAFKLQEEGFRHKQAQDAIINKQTDKKILIDDKIAQGLNNLRYWQGKQIGAETLKTNLNTAFLGNVAAQDTNATNMNIGNEALKQTGLGLKGNKPPIQTPMTRP
ncbi:hypothetical protein [Helicobacter felis]|uniref:hypothetical protein n=1 Tax=Helicobacter felis TaxID=214 RepID=UPI000CF071C3|nr:hypothetical protein [Helicobacter felis]